MRAALCFMLIVLAFLDNCKFNSLVPRLSAVLLPSKLLGERETTPGGGLPPQNSA